MEEADAEGDAVEALVAGAHVLEWAMQLVPKGLSNKVQDIDLRPMDPNRLVIEPIRLDINLISRVMELIRADLDLLNLVLGPKQADFKSCLQAYSFLLSQYG